MLYESYPDSVWLRIINNTCKMVEIAISVYEYTHNFVAKLEVELQLKRHGECQN